MLKKMNEAAQEAKQQQKLYLEAISARDQISQDLETERADTFS